MHVTLHIGLAKTGTTFLQAWMDFDANRRALGRGGLHVAGTAYSHRLASEHLENRGRSTKMDLVRIRRVQLMDPMRSAPPDSRLILSSEYFAICDPQSLGNALLANAADVTTIVCFLRRQDRWLASGYAQSVKATGQRKQPPLVGEYNDGSDWLRLVNRWQAAFPGARMVLLDYDRYKAPGTLLAAWKRIIGAEHIATTEHGKQSNPSLNAYMTEVVRMLNARGHPPIADKLVRLQGSPRPFAFSQKVTTEYEAAFIEGNRQLAEAFPECDLSGLCAPDWRSGGVDMTGQVTEERLAEVVRLATRRGWA